MKTTRILLTCMTVAATMLTLSVTDVSARTLTIKMSPGQLRGVCGQQGGAYGSNQRGDGMCLGNNGVVICHKDKVCTDGYAKMEVNEETGSGLPTLHGLSMVTVSPPEDHQPKTAVKADVQIMAIHKMGVMQ